MNAGRKRPNAVLPARHAKTVKSEKSEKSEKSVEVRAPRRSYTAAFKLQVVRHALQFPPGCRIKPVCALYRGIEPVQLRKWIARLACLEQLESAGLDATTLCMRACASPSDVSAPEERTAPEEARLARRTRAFSDSSDSSDSSRASSATSATEVVEEDDAEGVVCDELWARAQAAVSLLHLSI